MLFLDCSFFIAACSCFMDATSSYISLSIWIEKKFIYIFYNLNDLEFLLGQFYIYLFNLSLLSSHSYFSLSFAVHSDSWIKKILTNVGSWHVFPLKLDKFVSLTGLSFECLSFLPLVFGTVPVSVLISSPRNLICFLSPRNSSVFLVHW